MASRSKRRSVDQALSLFEAAGDHLPPFEGTQLFRNLGGVDFEDVSTSSGIRGLAGLPPVLEGRTLTWTIAMVDVDLDGDTDIVQADDQGPLPTAANGGFDIGYVHVLLNDGSGSFTDQPVIDNAISAGSWMGLSFGDLDCDGHLDLFGSNFGDYGFDVLGLPYALGDQATRWLLGQGGGTFADPGVGATAASVFGWGNAVVDYDNDGDQDLIYHGGLDLSLVMITDNPGVVLENQGCTADFTDNPEPLRSEYLRRNVHGVAVGDLNGDGFPDLVTASNLTIPPFLPLLPSPSAYGSPFDATGFFTSVFLPTPEGLVWSGADFGYGDVTVEISSADNGNGAVSVEVLGSVGLTALGQVNRDGIGAVVSFTPHQGDTVMTPPRERADVPKGGTSTERGDIDLAVLQFGGNSTRPRRVPAAMSTRRPLFLALSLLLTVGSAAADETPPSPATGQTYQLFQVTERVYAVFRHVVGSNAALVLLDGGVLVVDTHASPAAAREIVRAVAELTADPVRWVVNTHWHTDHMLGNEAYLAAFPDHVEILSHHTAREDMQQLAAGQMPMVLRFAGQELDALEKKLDEGHVDADTAEQARLFLDDQRREMERMEAMTWTLPTLTFERELRLHRRQEVHLLHFGRAHTRGDVVVYLPQEKVAITGDLLTYPRLYAGSSSHPVEWLDALKALAKLDFEKTVPGHGKVVLAGKQHLEMVTAILEAIVSQVRAAIDRGADRDEATAVDLSSLRQRWAGDSPRRQERFDAALAGFGDDAPLLTYLDLTGRLPHDP